MSKKQTNEKEIRLKIITLGNAKVGKTSFILKFTENTFDYNSLQTMGIDIKTKFIIKNGKKYRLTIYDTAGQEQFKAISLSTIKNADGIILMYDITNQKSYIEIKDWMDGIIENKGINFPIILIGNKCDLEDKRKVTYEEGQKLAKQNGLIFMETSNLNGKNIEEAGSTLLNMIIEKNKKEIDDILNSFEIIEEPEESDRIVLSRDHLKKNNKKGDKCC